MKRKLSALENEVWTRKQRGDNVQDIAFDLHYSESTIYRILENCRKKMASDYPRTFNEINDLFTISFHEILTPCNVNILKLYQTLIAIYIDEFGDISSIGEQRKEVVLDLAGSKNSFFRNHRKEIPNMLTSLNCLFDKSNLITCLASIPTRVFFPVFETVSIDKSILRAQFSNEINSLLDFYLIFQSFCQN